VSQAIEDDALEARQRFMQLGAECSTGTGRHDYLATPEDVICELDTVHAAQKILRLQHTTQDALRDHADLQQVKVLKTNTHRFDRDDELLNQGAG